MALTQARSAGAFTAGRYGSFAAKGGGEHPVDVLTQSRTHGGFTGKRYGSFAGRAVGHSVGTLTQPRSHAAFTGRRYGSFAGRTSTSPETPIPVAPSGRPYRFPVPADLAALQRQRLIEEDELLLLMAAQIAASGLLH